MKAPIALMLVLLLASPLRATALDANKVAYVGGTIPSFSPAHEPIEGRLELGPDQFMFVPFGGPHAATPLRIDYESIRRLELGQTQDRRTTLVVGATVLLGLSGFCRCRPSVAHTI
jgi:hypothetical protein